MRQVGGDIGRHDLGEWWMTELDDHDREVVRCVRGMVDADPPGVDEATPTDFLLAIASRCMDYSFAWSAARRAANKAFEIVEHRQSMTVLHRVYNMRIRIQYVCRHRLRSGIEWLRTLCEMHVRQSRELAEGLWKENPFMTHLPGHEGYTCLVLAYIEIGLYAEAIVLARAAARDGWTGEWDAYAAHALQELAATENDRSHDCANERKC